jgi:hypothetical protein
MTAIAQIAVNLGGLGERSTAPVAVFTSTIVRPSANIAGMHNDPKRIVVSGYDEVANVYLERFGVSTVRQKWIGRLIDGLPAGGGRVLQPFQIGFARQGGEDLVQNAHLDPAVIAALYGFVVAQSLRQIAPAPARAGRPQQRVQKPSIVGARTPLALAPAGHKRLKPLPLVISPVPPPISQNQR